MKVVKICTIIFLANCYFLWIKKQTRIKILLDVTELLDTAAIPYWMCQTTLLNAMRTGKLNPDMPVYEIAVASEYINDLYRVLAYKYNAKRHTKTKIVSVGIPVGYDYFSLTDNTYGGCLNIHITRCIYNRIVIPSDTFMMSLRNTVKLTDIYPLTHFRVNNNILTIPNNSATVNFTCYNNDCYVDVRSATETRELQQKPNSATARTLLYLLNTYNML
jgi:hypothetical protein